MKITVHRLRLLGLTSAFVVSIAAGAGYLARQRARADQVRAPLLPATVVEIPASTIEPGPAVAAPIRFAPLPVTTPRPAATGLLPARPIAPARRATSDPLR